MSFCPNCGSKVVEESKFCISCGTAISGNDMASTSMPSGMRTVEDVVGFYRNSLKLKEKYIEKYRPGIEKLIQYLTANEIIEFASHAIVGGLKNGSKAELACTNMRIIIVDTPSGLTSSARAMNGVFGAPVVSLRYDMIAGIHIKKGMLLGSVMIECVNGDTYDIGVDNPWIDIVYKGISNSVYQHMY